MYMIFLIAGAVIFLCMVKSSHNVLSPERTVYYRVVRERYHIEQP